MNRNIIIKNEKKKVNFREIRIGNIAPNILYRSSHPIKENKQEKIISLLATNVRIETVINLCDTKSGITRKALFAPWYNRLLKNNKVLSMNFSTYGKNIRRKIKKALQFIIITDGPWLIHCHAGIDRTGFVCMIIESFMGATLDDVINDYLESFNSIFESSVHNQTNRADSLRAMQILLTMSNSQTINEQNLQKIATRYLQNNVKLSPKEIELLRMKLERTSIKNFKALI